MTTARDVAAYILTLSGAMSAMKLQKLVYYCQVWHMVRREEALFGDPIEAWAAGPVVRSLFEAHRGRFSVEHPEDVNGNPEEVNEEARKTIKLVVEHYGRWSAEQLSDLSHTEQPWLDARKGLAPAERGDRVMDPTTMWEYYRSLSKRTKEDVS